jgi:hypothetical protein
VIKTDEILLIKIDTSFHQHSSISVFQIWFKRLFADVIHDAIWLMNIHEQKYPWFLAMYFHFLFIYFFLFSFCFVCLFFVCLFVVFWLIQYVFVMSFVSLCFCVLFMLYSSFYACIYRVVLCLSYFCWFSLSLHEMHVLLLYIIASVCLYLVCLCFWFDWLQNHITFCVQLNIIGDVFFCYFPLVAESKCFECWKEQYKPFFTFYYHIHSTIFNKTFSLIMSQRSNLTM